MSQKTSFLARLVGLFVSKKVTKMSRPTRKRTLWMETLEAREFLSVNPLGYDFSLPDCPYEYSNSACVAPHPSAQQNSAAAPQLSSSTLGYSYNVVSIQDTATETSSQKLKYEMSLSQDTPRVQRE